LKTPLTYAQRRAICPAQCGSILGCSCVTREPVSDDEIDQAIAASSSGADTLPLEHWWPAPGEGMLGADESGPAERLSPKDKRDLAVVAIALAAAVAAITWWLKGPGLAS